MRRRWLIAAASVPLMGFVAAFGLAPDTVTDTIMLQQVTQDVAFALSSPTERTADERYWREERIQRGDTVASILARLGVSDVLASDFLRSARSVRALRQLVPGRSLRVVTTEAGELLSLRYLHGDGTELVVRRDGELFAVSEQPLATQVRLVMASGEIRTSLFAATDEVGLNDAVAVQIADIFSGEVDFHRNLRAGDRFAVVYEALYHESDFIRSGRILSAEFSSDGRTHRALYFQTNDGQGGYYTPEGRNMRKTFLRSPLEFSRVSSGFSPTRFHPVLQKWRAHKGVDYSAPTGTRVKATGEGVVVFAGIQGGYGKVVILRHANGYETLYGHLSGFSRGLRVGKWVNQADLIGYVGMSGLATGAHLHYEFRIRGRHQNPLRLALPSAPSITREFRTAFDETSRPLLERLDLVRGLDLAMAH